MKKGKNSNDCFHFSLMEHIISQSSLEARKVRDAPTLRLESLYQLLLN